MRPVELGRLQPGETVEEHKAAVAAIKADLLRARMSMPDMTRTVAAVSRTLDEAADRVVAAMTAFARASAMAAPGDDPDEPLWFDAMRPDPDAEVWTP